MLRDAAGRAASRGERLERGARVGDDAERQRPGDADVARVDVDLDDAAAGGVAPVLVVGQVEIAEPRADDEDHVGLALHEIAARPGCPTRSSDGRAA